ncbi:MAG: MFS transporter [Gammaproteobacteria bacterium]|nr:MFS transporter [Gammaproteobacteria bacterium]
MRLYDRLLGFAERAMTDPAQADPGQTALPPRSAYPWFLTSSSLWLAGMSLQGFLFSWLLVGVLERPADEAGFARSLAEFPPLLVLFLGGLLGDRFNGRGYLATMHVLVALPPLLIAAVYGLGELGYWWVVLFGVLMASIQALSDPARQSLINRVTRMDIQRAVTIMIITSSLVGLSGFYLGGRLDDLGLGVVLSLQSLLFLAGTFAVLRLPSLPRVTHAGPPPGLAAGFRAVWQAPLVRNIISLNFLSSLFNAGAYVIAIPFIVKEVYEGGSAFFAGVMMVFSAGSIGSNVLLLAFMPLMRPGRVFLLMQLTRVVILLLLATQPSLWLFYATMFAWGVNMGVTTTLVRTTVQELADPTRRSQVMSILLLSFMVTAPVSSVLLGLLIEYTSPLSALLPGVAMSLIIFSIGVWKSGLWQFQSGSAAAARSA